MVILVLALIGLPIAFFSLRHNWTPWSEPFIAVYEKDVGHFGDSTAARYTVQTRRCVRCEKVEMRTVHDGERLR